MSSLPKGRSEDVFDDYKTAYTPGQALVEANRCIYCFDAPCITACPTAINIPEFIRKISTENVKGAAKTIFDSNILGMSCARVCPVEVLCVGDCVYNEMDVPPIQIGRLQRYATDKAYEEEWKFYEAGPDTGKKVALIGGGAASLAAAHQLRINGHQCTIYEKRDVLGGLNTTGVAPYKMPAERSLDEVQWLMDIGGIEVNTGVSVPGDIAWSSLLEDYDAIFLGFGLGPDRHLPVTGRDLKGIVGAVDYIEQFKCGMVDLAGIEQAIVVGGGNTAVDCVRELIGLGVPRVVMVYRGQEAQMSGYAHEWSAAKKEGARVEWQCAPVAYVGEGERVKGIQCIRLDENKRPIDGTEYTIDGDLVLLAIGQAKLGDLVEGLPGVNVDYGCIVVNEEGCTGNPKVFSGGDCANGGKEVVNAVAEGKRAAKAIHTMLNNGVQNA